MTWNRGYLENLRMLGYYTLDCSAWGFRGGSVAKNLPANAGDAGDAGSIIPGWGRSPGGGNDYLLQYPCLGNPMHRGAWWVTVHGVTKSQTRLSDWRTTTSHLLNTAVKFLANSSQRYPFHIDWPTKIVSDLRTVKVLGFPASKGSPF